MSLNICMYCGSEYSFICLVFSLVRIMLLYGCCFLGFFRLAITVALCLLRGYLRKQKHRYVWRNAG